jgi:hypothetical protein
LAGAQRLNRLLETPFSLHVAQTESTPSKTAPRHADSAEPVRPVTARGGRLTDPSPPEADTAIGRPAMCAQIHRFCLILAATSSLCACTMGHRIESPSEPILIEMTVLLKHEHVLRSGAAGG